LYTVVAVFLKWFGRPFWPETGPVVVRGFLEIGVGRRAVVW